MALGDLEPAARSSGAKSATAFRTISEVGKELEIPQHVLRFWETNFTQVKPLKRKGGRRLYSEGDISILRTIKKLINNDGYTVKGVKRFLSKNKISNIKNEGKIKISDELDVKLEHINNYLLEAKKLLKDEN